MEMDIRYLESRKKEEMIESTDRKWKNLDVLAMIDEIWALLKAKTLYRLQHLNIKTHGFESQSFGGYNFNKNNYIGFRSNFFWKETIHSNTRVSYKVL